MTRILIAEDEDRIASFLRKGFEANGYSTEVVEDGLQAVELARDADFDLMVLDLGLPERSGLEVLSDIRARGEKMPVIILTARDEVDTTVAGLEGGADDYMKK
ncbi:MAG: response regulator, partial [Acidimicrobiales bacterium]